MKPSIKRSFLSVVTLLALVFGAIGNTPVPAYATDAESASPEGLLNPDGTLNMNKTVNGTLDTTGWHVQMDPLRGPVFAPTALAAPNEWASVGWAWAGAFIDTDYVSTVAVSGTDVYVGGNFHDINNNGMFLSTADNIAKWDSLTDTWSALGSNGAGEGSLNNTVYAIAVSGTDLYVGGLFTDVNNNGTVLTTADYIAKWDGTNWSALGSNGAGDGAIKDYVSDYVDDYVNVIAVSGTDLYVGGNFIDVNNSGTIMTAADYIAKWDGANWSALGSNGAGNGALNGIVKALTVSGTDVYVGGIFDNGAGLPAADHVAKWDTLTGNWSALGSNGAGDGSLNAAVRTIAVSGTVVYVGGDFSNVNNNGTSLPAADTIAKWDGTNWAALGSNGAGDGSLNGWSSGIGINGTDVYVTGSFTNVNNNGTSLPTADYVAKWDGANWSALGSNGAGDGSLNSRGVDIVISGTNIYVTGNFTDVNNNGGILQTADKLVRWGTLTGNWSAVGANSIGGPLGNTVKAIAVSGTDVYVGGLFTNVSNNGAADHIAKWDSLTGNWSALGSNGAGDGALNNDVYAIAVSGANVYVGGRFTNVNNNGTSLPTADYVAKWDGTNWSALGSSDAGNGSLNDTVNAIAVSGTYVYVGGDFTDINNNETGTTRAGFIARWDGRFWQPLGANAVRARVNAIAVSGTGVYAGGDFTDVSYNGQPQYAADYIAQWNGTRWSALGSNDTGAPEGVLNGTVNAIAVSETGIYVGGQFTNINNYGTILPAADYIAKWDGTNWSALGSNGNGDGAINDYVDAIAVHETGIYVGGEFTDVNNNGTTLPAADTIAKWYGNAWSALGSNGTGNGAINNTVHAIAANETDIYVGGSFKNVNNNGAILPAADTIAAYGIEPHLTVTINRTASASYTSTRLLSFTAIFSEAVSGFTNTDVNVSLDVACNPTVTVTGSGSTYNVALTNMTKPCTATVSIPAGAVNSISHPAYVNLASTGLYNNQQYQYAIKQYRSWPMANDGWILESAAGSNKGGSFNNTAKILSVGDDSANREYRIISHFDTSYDPIPATAVITGINYRISQANITGINPLTTHGSLRTYLKVPYFGMSANLEVLDYHAGGDGGACIFDSTPIPNVLTEGAYRCLFFPVAFPLFPRKGTIELRVQFAADDADGSADLLNIYSGENTPNEWIKPQLFVTYYFLP